MLLQDILPDPPVNGRKEWKRGTFGFQRNYFVEFNNRFGCVYRACTQYVRSRMSTPDCRDRFSYVSFDSEALIDFEHKEADFNLMNRMLESDSTVPRGKGTSFLAALEKTAVLLEKYRQYTLKPILIFISDGEVTDDTHLARLKTLKEREQLSSNPFGLVCIAFSKDCKAEMLKAMVDIMGEEGTFFDRVLSADDLVSKFVTISDALKKRLD